MLSFIVLFLAALIHINPIKEKAEEEVATAPGNVQVDISWPSGAHSDVDLWVEGPTDARPVGYSNRSGILFNLLRDDLGKTGDSTPLNYENAYTHGAEDGEYVINVHLYNTHGDRPPIPVVVVVKYAADQALAAKEIITKTVELHTLGQEITVVRFTLKDGEIVPDATNTIPKKLRSGSTVGGSPSVSGMGAYSYGGTARGGVL
jgi:hypothetical protein